MVIESIGLGMLASFFMTEAVGLAAGGIVVPGYFALYLHEPVRVAMTLLVAFAAFVLLKLLSKVMLVYGRRMLVLAVLVSYLLGYVTKSAPSLVIGANHLDVSVIGYVIPGLVAYWMVRQGVVETLATLAISAVLTRLVITVISGGAF
jgi:gamma-polyglutamate biosynthesis protein CapC